jgi:septum site-determining protein MinC
MVTIKGLRQGLLIVFSFENEPWLARLRELEEKFITNEAFFAGGRMTFDVGPLLLSPDDIQRSVALLAEYQIQLLAIITKNDTTHSNISAAGIANALPVTPTSTRSRASSSSTETQTETQRELNSTKDTRQGRDFAAVRTASTEDVTEESATNSAFFKGKLRSGQTVKHPGHVIVIGDVNPGGQILAGGDIIIWGRLQGSAHAGAFGDLNAVVCALEMTPTLLRIADLTVRNHKGKTEIARVEQQQMVFSAWEKS